MNRTEIDLLQGVWFPTHESEGGHLTAVNESSFPAPPSVWLLTVLNDTFHVTASREYYATGGWLRLSERPGWLTFAYAGVPPEFHVRSEFRIDGDELQIMTDGLTRSLPTDWVSATRYVRVALAPTPAMAALIEERMTSLMWTGKDTKTDEDD